MHRNLDRRVEVLVRIPSEHHVNELTELLELYCADSSTLWRLGPSGEWKRHLGDDDIQETLIERARARRASVVRTL